jgi:hypothetical protein
MRALARNLGARVTRAALVRPAEDTALLRHDEVAMAWQVDKARENLRVGSEALKKGEVNAAANRLYYAFYHLAWRALERAGFRPAQFHAAAQDSWRHETILANPRLIARCLLGEESRPAILRVRVLLRTLYEERVIADYRSHSARPLILAQALSELATFFREK